MKSRRDPLEELEAAVLAAAKYRHVSPELVRAIGSQELAHRRSVKEAIKSTKNKLHQVAAVYLPGSPDYAAWLAELAGSASDGDCAQVRAACRGIMQHHASTRERLATLEQFYTTTLAELGPIHRILDIACGLNPLSLPWMPLAPGAEYYAYDIYVDMMTFLGGVFDLERSYGPRRVIGHAAVLDVVKTPPEEPADLALILKAIPCLEQLDKSAGARLLHSVQADHLLVSFPAHSLGGKSKGMPQNYEARFYSLIAGAGWSVRRFEFAAELVFLISR